MDDVALVVLDPAVVDLVGKSFPRVMFGVD